MASQQPEFIMRRMQPEGGGVSLKIPDLFCVTASSSFLSTHIYLVATSLLGPAPPLRHIYARRLEFLQVMSLLQAEHVCGWKLVEWRELPA